MKILTFKTKKKKAEKIPSNKNKGKNKKENIKCFCKKILTLRNAWVKIITTMYKISPLNVSKTTFPIELKFGTEC